MVKKNYAEFVQSVDDILFLEWDPIGINTSPQCRDEYNGYAPKLCEMILEGADEYKIAHYLSEIQRVSMGLSCIDEERNRQIARRLRALQN
jgi:hypothetical protein